MNCIKQQFVLAGLALFALCISFVVCFTAQAAEQQENQAQQVLESEQAQEQIKAEQNTEEQVGETGFAGLWICQSASRIAFGMGPLTSVPCSENITIRNVDAEGVPLSIELIPYNSFVFSSKSLQGYPQTFSLDANGCIVTRDTMPWERICYNKEQDTLTRFFSTGNTDVTTVYTRHKPLK